VKIREGILKKWLRMAKDEPQWKQIIQEYFEKCKTINKENPGENSSTNDSDEEDFYNYKDRDL
jgi:hypothetical protein